MALMEKWARIKYIPVLPLGENNTKITGSREHVDISRKAAEEGIVLLKNQNCVLPLEEGTKIAVFGVAQIAYMRVGRGSGNVYSEYEYNVYEALKLRDDKISVFDPLSKYYAEYFADQHEKGISKTVMAEPEVPSELADAARAFADTAIITLRRSSCEGYDHYADGTDDYFNLSSGEKEMIDAVCARFESVIVMLNVGAMIDTSWFAYNDKISAALMIWQGGMEGAAAAADVLVGDVNPSGKLVDTCAADFSDYPSSEGFHESADYVKYTEDIFVGYRYFETIPGKKERVVYPFGFGLSYTQFSISKPVASLDGDDIAVSVTVKNIGDRAGKEVVQVYYSAPRGTMSKPAIELAAFAKTRLLAPNEEETIELRFAVNDMASYDDIGDVCKSAWVLEEGEYTILVGNSCRSLQSAEYKYVTKTRVVSQLHEFACPTRLGKRLTESGEYVSVPDREVTRAVLPDVYETEFVPVPDGEKPFTLRNVYEGKCTLDAFISQMTDEELARLLKGKANRGVADTCGMGGNSRLGIPTPMTVDGPAGVRIREKTGVRTTAFPIATMLACTWNVDIVEAVGRAGALECKENNLSMWLTPGLNIHRSPLCGRNFEYYSEDPLVSGKMAAAKVRGIQSVGIAATAKHFACNNKEVNREESDSIVSERAIREIYIKGFEICVKEAAPKLIMTSYNIINGVRASENAELIMGILRGEWGYGGLVITDWLNHASFATEVKSGNDVRMPVDATEDLLEKVQSGYVKREELVASAKRLLELILWFE